MELVHCDASDGIRLDGTWHDATPDLLPVQTLVIMHHGVGGTFFAAGFFEESVSWLTRRGMHVLRANNRGHDIVSRPAGGNGGYAGAAFEAMDDCYLDWEAWCTFAVKKGITRIVLWGHSLGAVKSILYCARTPLPQVCALVASSPPRFSYSQFARLADEWPEFEEFYLQAKALVESGAGNTLIEVRKPTPLLIAAARFVEKYGPDEHYDYFRYLGKLSVPTLITIGSKEGVEARPGLSRLAFWEAAESVPAVTHRHPNVSFATIRGGDHAYTGVGDSLRAAVQTFLQSAGIFRPDGRRLGGTGQKNGVSEGT